MRSCSILTILIVTKDEIKKKLKDANISEVARNSGVHRNTISRVLNDKEIMSDALLKLAAYLESRDK